MAKLTKISPRKEPARSAELFGSPKSIADAIKFMLANLSEGDREAVLAEITEFVNPISIERAGNVLGVIIKFAQKNHQLTVDNLKEAVREAGLVVKPKEVYNAVGYLSRKGHIRRVGYGRYVVDGIEIVTSEDIGGAPSRYEDGYRLNDSDQ